jgi:hypothetical protein
MGIFDMFRSNKETPSNIASNGGLEHNLTATNPIQPIGSKEVQEANQILNKYKEAKADLEARILENEKWYKLRHWHTLRKEQKQIEPTSPWLFNCIQNKLADAMDNFPAPTVLPREEMDKGEAQRLSSILPVILEQNDFEKTYSQVTNYKLKFGTGVYGVFWDNTLLNGLGDITIRKVDVLSLYWEAGITDIQKSRNVFHIELVDNDVLEDQYPQLINKLGSSTIDVTKYAYDEKVDTSKKSAVVDWYYKKRIGGRTVLHYVKYVNDNVLYASENDPNFAERGWYDHGEYPFHFDILHEVEGTIAGLGWIDIGKNTQGFIDRGNQAIMQNMLANSKPRFFYSNSTGINLDEYANTDNEFVRVEGTLGEDYIMPIQGKPLNDIYVSVVMNAIEELKETTGNRDVSQGGTTGGVTAASAIAAQMEAGSKLSRTSNKATYRTFRGICLQVIELIRQFYDTQRQFRIIGASGMEEYVSYSNANIAPMAQGSDFSIDMGFRKPLFDLQVSAQKQSPYSKMSQNELALQFYNAGFFNPAMADQALMCLDMMDFDRKSAVMDKIRQNSQMFMMMQQMMMGAPIPNGEADVDETEALGGNPAEPKHIEDAKKKVADSTSPV